SYYEWMWGGPEDEEFEEWLEEIEQEDEFGEWDEEEPDFDEDFGQLTPPLPAPLPGDEGAARQHFAALKRKYRAESYQETAPLSHLYKILLKLESMEPLDNADQSWLRQNRLRGPIRVFATREAMTCERCFRETGDSWEAVRASRFWRMADSPGKALAVTEGLA